MSLFFYDFRSLRTSTPKLKLIYQKIFKSRSLEIGTRIVILKRFAVFTDLVRCIILFERCIYRIRCREPSVYDFRVHVRYFTSPPPPSPLLNLSLTSYWDQWSLLKDLFAPFHFQSSSLSTSSLNIGLLSVCVRLRSPVLTVLVQNLPFLLWLYCLHIPH